MVNKKWLFVFLLIAFLFIGFVFIMLVAARSRELAKKETTKNAPTDTIQHNTTKYINDTSITVLANGHFYQYHYRNSIHCPFGCPYDSDTTDDYILEKPQFTISYCSKKNVANWVAWQLNASWVGNEDRFDGKFISDNTLPASFYKVKHSDYINSGYDRGHLVRSKERTRNGEDNRATFLLTNIVPQTPDLNRGVWLRFEDYYLNKALKENKNMFIVSGGIFRSNKTLKNKGIVAIPDSCYKIVLFTLKEKIEEISNRNDFEIVAISMPNIQGIRNDNWQKYITTVDKIEYSTGYDFFMLLPDSIENYLESRLKKP